MAEQCGSKTALTMIATMKDRRQQVIELCIQAIFHGASDYHSALAQYQQYHLQQQQQKLISPANAASAAVPVVASSSAAAVAPDVDRQSSMDHMKAQFAKMMQEQEELKHRLAIAEKAAEESKARAAAAEAVAAEAKKKADAVSADSVSSGGSQAQLSANPNARNQTSAKQSSQQQIEQLQRQMAAVETTLTLVVENVSIPDSKMSSSASAASAATFEPVLICCIDNCTCNRFVANQWKPAMCDRCHHYRTDHCLDSTSISQLA